MNNVPNKISPPKLHVNQSQNAKRQVFTGPFHSPVLSPLSSGQNQNQGGLNQAISNQNPHPQRNAYQGLPLNKSPGLTQFRANNQWHTGQQGINQSQNVNYHNRQNKRQNQFQSHPIHRANYVRQRDNFQQNSIDRQPGINNQIVRPTRENNMRTNNSQQSQRSVFAQPNGQRMISPPSAANQSRQVALQNQILFSKMDGIFAEAFKSLRLQHIASILSVFTLLLALLLLYKFKTFKGVADHQYGFNAEEGHLKFSILPFLVAFQSLICFCQLYYIVNGFFSLHFALLTAQKINSVSSEQPADLTKSFNQNVSMILLSAQASIYYEQEIDSQQRKNLIEQGQKRIERNVKDQFCCSYQIVQISRFGMFICSIVTFVALAQGYTTWLQKLILITTIVYWMLRNYRKFFYIGLMLICPLASLIAIFYFCFCQGKPKDIQIPIAKNPTQQQIFNSGGTCSICMMEFEKSDNVVTLPCSDKHMFHQLCISGWLSLKTTCPICRFDMAQ